MNFVLDTCLFLYNDEGQSKVRGFSYSQFEKLISDTSNTIFVTGFSVLELFCIKKHSSLNETCDYLLKKYPNLQFLEYNTDKLNVDFSKYSYLDKYAAIIYYHLTGFLSFLVYQIILSKRIDDSIDNIHLAVKKHNANYFNIHGKATFETVSKFMKDDSVDYIIYCTKETLLEFDCFNPNDNIWKIIGETKIHDNFLFRGVGSPEYFRYAKYIVELFKTKYANKAAKIQLSFGFLDLLIAHASNAEYMVVSADKDLCRYLLKYGTEENKIMIRKIWDVDLETCSNLFKNL